MEQGHYYAILYAPGSGWSPGRPWFEQDLRAHHDYLRQLFHEKKVTMAGPFNDHSGGQAIVRVGNADEAWTIARHDPAVIDGVFTVQVRPWQAEHWLQPPEPAKD